MTILQQILIASFPPLVLLRVITGYTPAKTKMEMIDLFSFLKLVST